MLDTVHPLWTGSISWGENYKHFEESHSGEVNNSYRTCLAALSASTSLSFQPALLPASLSCPRVCALAVLHFHATDPDFVLLCCTHTAQCSIIACFLSTQMLINPSPHLLYSSCPTRNDPLAHSSSMIVNTNIYLTPAKFQALDHSSSNLYNSLGVINSTLCIRNSGLISSSDFHYMKYTKCLVWHIGSV